MSDAPHTPRLPLAARLRGAAANPGVLLAAFSLATALILAGSDELTSAAIATRATEDLYASLSQVVPDGLHDNDLTANTRVIADAEEGEVPVYLATAGGTPTAVAFGLTGYGYGGPIRVLIGIAPDGVLLGVRVLSHAETPGLGDKIELAKSDWIAGFTGHSLTDPAPEGWKVRKDGGVFDQFSGATITPRAVVGTVHRGLAFFARNRDALLAAQEAG